jgi:hypothetical protein
MRTALVIVGGALLLGIGFGVGFVAGGMTGWMNAQHERSLAEETLLRSLLKDDPAYRSIEVQWRSLGGVDLYGSVPTKADKERLRAAVVRAVGEAWAKDRWHVDAPAR